MGSHGRFAALEPHRKASTGGIAGIDDRLSSQKNAPIASRAIAYRQAFHALVCLPLSPALVG